MKHNNLWCALVCGVMGLVVWSESAYADGVSLDGVTPTENFIQLTDWFPNPVDDDQKCSVQKRVKTGRRYVMCVDTKTNCMYYHRYGDASRTGYYCLTADS